MRMDKKKALEIAKEIDGDVSVDCQELVIDIYNDVEYVLFEELTVENKKLHLDIEKLDDKPKLIENINRTLLWILAVNSAIFSIVIAEVIYK